MDELLYLPVSIGEAIDKLSILDIKREKINREDQRLKEVIKEYDLLYEKLNPFIENNRNLYHSMKKINLIIWDQMNVLRDDKTINGESYLNLCKECIDCNDIRFRIKNKINLSTKSIIKEQKSYVTNALILNINQNIDNENSILIKMIEILSYVYDKLIIYSDYNIEILKSKFYHDNTIHFTDEEVHKYNYELNEQNYKIILNDNKLLKKIFDLI